MARRLTAPSATGGALRRFSTIAAPLALLGIAVALRLPLCPSALLLRIPCPGCGLTRATLALLSGDVATAIELQPVLPLVLLLFGSSLGWVAVQYVATGRSTPPRWALAALIASFALLFLVWSARLFGAFGGPVAV